MECQRNGCTKTASHAPCLRVPPVGHAARTGQPDARVPVIVGLQLCRDHADAFWLEAPLAIGMKNNLDALFRGMGLRDPDFVRGISDPVPLESDDYKTFDRNRNMARAEAERQLMMPPASVRRH